MALIDDGVDHASLNSYDDRAEVRGMSYWTPAMSNFLQIPSWHRSTNGHGTIMANSIIRVNPWVSLYAMRIQDDVQIGPGNNVNVWIHPGSAARAIEDAIILEVDIISISWTIHDPAASDTEQAQGQDTNGTNALRAAISSAKDKGILIFCSASDDIKKKGSETLPYNQERDYIFRIGAADAYGWSDKATGEHLAIDYYFLPGNQVADDGNPRLLLAEELKYRDSSSVATALAAGLASLVLYLVNFMKIYHTSDAQNMNKMSRYRKNLGLGTVLKRPLRT